ncbi:MAG: DNA gyrase subunit A [Candidatus Karelsulcia muelleri]
MRIIIKNVKKFPIPTLNSIYFDGLKPVHRRVLYGMYEHFNKKNYRKSARIVGDDSSVYEAIVRSWSLSLRSTLIDGQGIIKFFNNAEIYKLHLDEKVSEEMLFDLKKDTVDIKLNKEPIVLPTVIPNLLIIAVGIKNHTNFIPFLPCHYYLA